MPSRAPLAGAWRRPARVVALGADLALVRRLEALTAAGVPLRTIDVEVDLWAGLATIASHRPDTVLYVLDAFGGSDDGLAGLSLLRVEADDVRVVVMSNRVEILDEAFDLGADVWIADAADDGTLAAALTGSRDPR